MTAQKVMLPIEYFGSFTKGKPVFNGKIYVGQPDTDPEIPANQKQITATQEDGSEVLLPQPALTGSGGYPTYNGSPVELTVEGAYSVKVLDKNNNQEYYFPNVVGDASSFAPPTFKKVAIPVVPGATILDAGVDFTTAVVLIDGVTQFETAGQYSYGPTSSSVTLATPLTGDEQEIEMWVNEIFFNGDDSERAIYASVAQMVADNSLPIGTLATTKGYFFSGDGGGGDYLISAPFATDNFRDHTIVNGNSAVLQFKDTILLEQCGVTEGATTTGELQAAADSGAKLITSRLSEFFALEIMILRNSNVTVDLINTRIVYQGDYDVYLLFPDYDKEFGDRTVGLITARGTKGENVQVVSSTVEAGVSVLTIPDASIYSVGDYVHLDITYPRREADLLAQIIKIDGNDITTNYTFAWDVDAVSVTNMVKVIENVNIKLNWYDDADAITSRNRVSGIGLQYVVGGTCSWNVENNYQPAYITNICYNVNQDGGVVKFPKNVGPGQGYNCQLNNTNVFSTRNLEAVRCRHIWDATHSMNGEVSNCYAISNDDAQTWQYTTHGAYEHDIKLTNINQSEGQNAFSWAQAGSEFGEQSRRIVIDGATFSGVSRCRNAKEGKILNVDYTGTQSVNHEFGAFGDLYLENIRFNDAPQVVFYSPTDDTGDVVKGVNPTAYCKNVDFNNTRIRNIEYFGSLSFENCTNIGIFDRSPSNTFEPRDYTFRSCDLDTSSSWVVSCSNDLVIENCNITMVNSLAVVATNSTSYNGGTLKGGASYDPNARIKFSSRSVNVSGVSTQNSMGIWAAEIECKSFVMNGVTGTLPDSGHTSQQFSMENCTDCTMVVTGSSIEYDGTGISIDFGGIGGTNINAILSGTYAEGNINVAGSVTSFQHAATITPDTVLPAPF